MLVAMTSRLRRAAGSIPGEAIFKGVSELIHTCYRIGDIDRSVSFYEKLGFEELRRSHPRRGHQRVHGPPGDGARLELTYNHGVDS